MDVRIQGSGCARPKDQFDVAIDLLVATSPGSSMAKLRCTSLDGGMVDVCPRASRQSRVNLSEVSQVLEPHL